MITVRAPKPSGLGLDPSAATLVWVTVSKFPNLLRASVSSPVKWGLLETIAGGAYTGAGGGLGRREVGAGEPPTPSRTRG